MWTNRLVSSIYYHPSSSSLSQHMALSSWYVLATYTFLNFLARMLYAISRSLFSSDYLTSFPTCTFVISRCSLVETYLHYSNSHFSLWNFTFFLFLSRFLYSFFFPNYSFLIHFFLSFSFIKINWPFVSPSMNPTIAPSLEKIIWESWFPMTCSLLVTQKSRILS